MKTPKQYRNMEYIDILKGLAHLLKPKTYVEIGVKHGFTFFQMAPLVGKAIGVDITPLEPVCGSTTPMEGVYKTRNIEFYHMSSKTFWERWKHPIDFLFIDANHEYNAVMFDFSRFAPLVRLHTGLIFMHDTHPVREELLDRGYCHNAWRAAATIQRKLSHMYEIVTFPGPWAGLSIARRIGDGRNPPTHGWMERMYEQQQLPLFEKEYLGQWES